MKVERAKTSTGKLAEALTIGGYLYAEFFHRSEMAYSSKSKNSPSLRALMDNPAFAELDLSRQTIANYIVATIQADRFEAHIAKGRLPATVREVGYTQRLRLAPCRSTLDWLRIATMAAEERLSPGAVEKLVKAANAKATTTSRPAQSEIVRQVKSVLKQTAELCGLDAASAERTDLEAVTMLAAPAAKALGLLVDSAEGELASRPDSILPSTRLGLGAPDELDALTLSVLGEDLGLGAAVRESSAAAVRHHGARIIECIADADPKAVKEWFLDFVVAAAAKLGAADDIRERLWSKPDKNLTKSQPPSRGRRAWYVVFGRDVAVPEEPGSVFNVLDTRLKENKCIVQAIDEDEAVAQFRQRADGLDADVGDPAREIGAERSSNSSGPAKVSVAMYLRRPLSERLPTLDEYVNRAPVTPNPRR